MAIKFHPDPGTVVICDFTGYVKPEMVKRRPAVVVSPRLRQREGLCTIVPLSTTRPNSVCAYHCQLDFDPPLPRPYSEPRMWVKADMLCAVSFSRLSLPLEGTDLSGKRIYDIRHLSDAEMKMIRDCILNGMGLGTLTAHL